MFSKVGNYLPDSSVRELIISESAITNSAAAQYQRLGSAEEGSRNNAQGY
jgi:hypothetical protein